MVTFSVLSQRVRRVLRKKFSAVIVLNNLKSIPQDLWNRFLVDFCSA